ncbi:425_t:CDS:1, partial [Funneliformis geosporum]
SHCNSQKHKLNIKKHEETQNNTQQLTLSSIQEAVNSKKHLIKDLINTFAVAEIFLKK